MREFIVSGAVLVLGVAMSTAVAHAQKRTPDKLSPAESASCAFQDGKTINTSYSSPRMRGRKIFATDGLVPYGKPWRAGAQEATTFETTANLEVDGKSVPAGNYTIFALPNADQWKLIISKKTGEWGIPYPGEQYELGRYDMKVSSLPSPVENFTILYTPHGNTCTLQMEWATTRASVDLTEK
ncbi:MAG TPA: DUF2911 domain-containing protein [Candidatus Acidoferrales bacterium]|nr:DUF2911 domain-containing protein [Candidatus Acidoferrales bacterium]